MSEPYDSNKPMFANDDYGMIVRIPNPANRGFHAAYAAYEPTPEDREAQSSMLRDLGLKAAQDVESRVMKAMFGK